MLIEIMREQTDYRLPLNGKHSNRIYAEELVTTEEKIKQFIKDCIEEFKLFDSDGEYFWSNSLIRRMAILEERRRKLSEAGKRGADKKWGGYSQANGHPNGQVVAVKESKVKKSKVNKVNKKEYAPTVHLTEEEHQKLVELIGDKTTKNCIIRLSDFKNANGRQYKSDYYAIRKWVIKAETGKEPTEFEKETVLKCPKCGSSQYHRVTEGLQCYSCGHMNKGSPK